MGFRYNGVHSDDMGIYKVTSVRRSLLPPITSRLLSVPGRGGAYYHGREYGVREIEVGIVLAEPSLPDLRARVRALAAWLQPGREPKPLVFDDEPNLTWMAVLSGDTDLEEIVAVGRGTLTFVCPDPVALGPEHVQTIAAADATFARNSVAYKSDGTQVASGQPRFQTVSGRTGVLVEEGTTNLVQNSKSVGGSGSTPPQRWVIQDDPGAFSHNFAADTIFPDHVADTITINNTSGSAKNGRLYFENNIAVSQGQVVTVSIYAELLSGTPVQLGIGFHKLNSSGGYVGEASFAFTPTATRQRVSYTYTVESGVAFVRPRFVYYNIPNGANFVVRILAPQVEVKPYPTSYMISSNTGTVTRAAEMLTVPKEILNTSEGTIEAWVSFNDVSDAHYGAIFTYGGSAPGPRLLIMRDRSSRKIGFWDGDGTDEVVVFGSTVVTTNVWYYVAFTWSPNGRALYVNGVKEATNARGKPLGSVVENPRLGVWGTGSWLNGFLGPVRISRRARTDQEIADAYAAGTLEADEDTTALYTFDNTLAAQAPDTVNAQGTADAFPVIKATVQQPITHLAVATPDKYVLLGRPESVEETKVPKEEVVRDDGLGSTVGWATGTQVDGMVAGTMVSTGSGFEVQSYGSGSGWHGPALKTSLPDLLQDFRVTVWLQLTNSKQSVGRAELYLLDANNAIIGKIALKDTHAGVQDMWGEARAGALSGGYYFVPATHGDKAGVWNNFSGLFRIGRISNRWHAYFAMIDSKGRHHTRLYQEWYDAKGQYAAPLAQVQLHAGAYGTYQPMTVRFDRVLVERINKIVAGQVPYIAYPGDVLEIDCERHAVYLNGEPRLDLLDIGSQFFSLEPGQPVVLGVTPEGVATVELTYRERWL